MELISDKRAYTRNVISASYKLRSGKLKASEKNEKSDGVRLPLPSLVTVHMIIASYTVFIRLPTLLTTDMLLSPCAC